MERRQFINRIAAVTAGLWATRYAVAAPMPKLTTADIDDMRRNWQALARKDLELPSPAAAVTQSREEWKRQLTPIQYDVLREEGTERPFTSPLNEEKRPGIFACAGCGLPLFTSRMKYDSGTGWPSFVTSIPDHLASKQDRKLFLPRTEYHCVRCGGHHGHVFDDGPRPIGERWCNNGVALKFLPTRLA
ncbi:MAG: peptide-methionine (R)-S-oxide reductase MsrB [Casimicrobiaceae bacterium]